MPIVISDILRESRARRGQSLEAAAREMGVSWLTVWAWEHGKQTPSLQHFEVIMEYVQKSKGKYERKGNGDKT